MNKEVQYLPLDLEAMHKARQFSQSACVTCIATTELCPACQDLKDVRDVDIAHQIVDEGNLQYKFIWSVIREQPSGHDWTDREGEFLEPIALLADRLYDIETSLTVTANETVCESCHYIHNKAIACPNCN